MTKYESSGLPLSLERRAKVFVADFDDIILEQPEERDQEVAKPKKPVKGKKEA